MDVPARTGLGSSSSFTVALLQASYTLNNQPISTRELADMAVYIERDLLREEGGKQDQFIATYGGIQSMSIDRAGNVEIAPLDIAPDIVHDLEGRLMMFYTGVQRESPPVQAKVTARIRSDAKVTRYLHRVKEIGFESARALSQGDLDGFGQLMDLHWREKRQMAEGVSSSSIDELYEVARDSGAAGGKLIGAGGGGYLLFYCPNGDRESVRRAMVGRGLRELRFRFASEGSTVLTNLP
jgi:D-glycero-alpha-D-manno-heptose-7-phosphate kinase